MLLTLRAALRASMGSEGLKTIIHLGREKSAEAKAQILVGLPTARLKVVLNKASER